jgi:hypothetical protein
MDSPAFPGGLGITNAQFGKPDQSDIALQHLLLPSL